MTDAVLHAIGTFTVSLTPQHTDGTPDETAMGRLSIAKTWSGGIDGTSSGEMLTAMTSMKGSAAYVAVERVRGSVDGREGTFAMYHRGLSDRGVQSLSIEVVPDSGTGALVGIVGELSIVIAGGVHSYDLAYRLPKE